MSAEFPYTCRDDHEEIGYRVEREGDERCPVCVLRDWLREIGDSATSGAWAKIAIARRDQARVALKSYPFSGTK